MNSTRASLADAPGDEGGSSALNRSTASAGTSRGPAATLRDASDVLVKAQALLADASRKGQQHAVAQLKSLVALSQRSVEIARDLQSRARAAAGSTRLEAGFRAVFDEVGAAAPRPRTTPRCRSYITVPTAAAR